MECCKLRESAVKISTRLHGSRGVAEDSLNEPDCEGVVVLGADRKDYFATKGRRRILQLEE